MTRGHQSALASGTLAGAVLPEAVRGRCRRRYSLKSSVSIGQVLDELSAEFPDISPSKIRFLEAEGLIQPLRSSSGYRRFSVADIKRLRFILTAQRDEYLPLRVIKERLDALDGAAAAASAGGVPGGDDQERAARRGRRRRGAARRARGLRPHPAREILRNADAFCPPVSRATRRVRRPAAPPAGRQGGRRPRDRPGRAGRGAADQAEGQPRARAARRRRTSPGISPRLHATLVEDGLAEAGLASQPPHPGTPRGEPGEARGLRSASGR